MPITACFISILISAAPLMAAEGPVGQLSATAAKTAAVPPVSSAAAETPDLLAIAGRCAPPADSEPVLYQSDFHWGYSPQELRDRFKEIYASPKRLDKRAYWDKEAGSLVVPPWRDGPLVKLGPRLINALRRHIERALELGYAEAVFFPDMGHSHLLIPEKLWESKYSNYSLSEDSLLYEDMLSDPAIHIFYHTAEQLTMLEDNQPIDDDYLRFRLRHRSIGGPIAPDAELTAYQNPESSANTVRTVPGYRWWGAGFNFSAQKDGCFPYTYKGKTYYYDISLHDLPMKPGSGSTYDWY